MKRLILHILLLFLLTNCAAHNRRIIAERIANNPVYYGFINSCEAERRRCLTGWNDPTCANFMAASSGLSCQQMWSAQYNIIRN